MGGTSPVARTARTERPDGGGSPISQFDEDFDRLALAGRDCVVLAVSGGSDSMALMQLFTGYAQRVFPSLRVLVATVDHRLRKEAAAEARFVAKEAERLGIEHRTLVWDGAKPAAGLMEAARDARHRLLSRAAQEAGTDLVLVAHTMDDQAETVAMRSARSEGGRGRAGIAAATLSGGETWFARPLLGARRAVLRQVLERAGTGWIDDPSNDDFRYERVRMRAMLNNEEIRVFGEAARNEAARRQALGEAAAALIDQHATMPVPGLIRIEPALFDASGKHAAIYALRILLSTAGGQTYLPDERRSAEALSAIMRGSSRLTLAGAVAERSSAGVYLYREYRNLPARGDTSLLWDGRCRVAYAEGRDFEIGEPDKATVEASVESSPAGVPPRLARAAYARQPAIWRGDECIGLAGDVEGTTCEAVAAPWARYLPSFDLAAARAVSSLIGAGAVPKPPFNGRSMRGT
ncbi:MAG: tRNA lysidine(34) synthetase TilS [Rhizobiaceae bacterium]|nr:tRNA lysidine(34) synthetase TilS [Rhizobiaceae bacterium]